jgi:membrane-associated protein
MGHIIFFDIERIISEYGYIGITLVVFLESGILFALPGDSLLFTAGIVASASGLKLFVLIPLIFLGSYMGSIVGFYIGKYLERLHKYEFFRKIFKPEHVEKAHSFFSEHGRFSIIISRFVPIVRTFTPIVAGVADMDKKAFLRYSFLGALIWSTSITMLGYFLGKTFPFLRHYLSEIIVLIVIISVVPVILKWQKERKKSL